MGEAAEPRRAAIGDTLPPFRREAGLGSWNRFAAVNDEFVPIHMEDEAGRAAGYPGAFGMGNLLWSYLHCLLRDWLGDDGRIEHVACQFRSVATKGMMLTARGEITEIEEQDGERRLDLRVWIENDAGSTLSPGTATVVVPAGSRTEAPPRSAPMPGVNCRWSAGSDRRSSG